MLVGTLADDLDIPLFERTHPVFKDEGGLSLPRVIVPLRVLLLFHEPHSVFGHGSSTKPNIFISWVQ